MTAVLTGQADIGLAGPEACIYVYNQARAITRSCSASSRSATGRFSSGARMCLQLGAAARQDRHRRRAGGVPEMTLEYVMRQNGVVPGTDATVDTTVQFNMMAGAFTGGNGDFVTLFEPTATEVAQAGKGPSLRPSGRRAARSRIRPTLPRRRT